VLATAAFVALALAFALFIRRAGRFIAETREVETFPDRRPTWRHASKCRSMACRCDAVRRRTVAAEAITENIAAATDAVER
jgi:hypothetical protein